MPFISLCQAEKDIIQDFIQKIYESGSSVVDPSEINITPTVKKGARPYSVSKKNDKKGGYDLQYDDQKQVVFGFFNDWRVHQEPVKYFYPLNRDKKNSYPPIVFKSKIVIDTEEIPVDLKPYYDAKEETHAYFIRKKLPGVFQDVRVSKNGSTAFTGLRRFDDLLGDVATYQKIYYDTKVEKYQKMSAKGGGTGGFVIGDITQEKVVLCEGVGTGLSIAKATDYPVLCATGKGNMEKAVLGLKKINPSGKIVLAMENDMKDKVAETLFALCKKYSLSFVFPKSKKQGADFNDDHVELGLDSVKETFMNDVVEPKIEKKLVLRSPDELECVNEILKFIEDASHKEIVSQVYPKVNDLDLSSSLFDAVAKGVKKRLGLLTNTSISVSNIKRDIKDLKKEKNQDHSWINEIIFNARDNNYYSIPEKDFLCAEAFNTVYARKIPLNPDGSELMANKFARKSPHLRIAYGQIYAPTVDEIYTTNPYDLADTKMYINTFDPESIPEVPEAFTKEGLDFIEKRIKPHIKMLWNTDENTEIMLNWLAYTTQRKETMLGWCPLIQSVGGVGKNVFSSIISACVGVRNLSHLSTQDLDSDFNEWSSGSLVNVFNELLIANANRKVIYNKIKPYITADERIKINNKGVKRYDIMPRTSYIAYTNYKDCIRLDPDDRRIFVVFNQFSDDKEQDLYLKEVFGMTRYDYFSSFLEDLRKYGSEVRKYFLEMEISKEFLKTIGKAPKTRERELMIASSDACTEGQTEIEGLIFESKSKYYNDIFVCSNHLFKDLDALDEKVELKTSKKNHCLRKMGYTLLPGRTEINTLKTQVWVKDSNLEIDEIKDYILNGKPIKKYAEKLLQKEKVIQEQKREKDYSDRVELEKQIISAIVTDPTGELYPEFEERLELGAIFLDPEVKKIFKNFENEIYSKEEYLDTRSSKIISDVVDKFLISDEYKIRGEAFRFQNPDGVFYKMEVNRLLSMLKA